MIITLTPNPSIDRTITVDQVRVGAVNRASHSQIDPGGKGVNVSRALVANGHPTRAVLPLGGPDGDLLAKLLVGAGVDHDAVSIAGKTRTNIALVDPAGVTTKINEPGPRLSPAELAHLTTLARGASPSGWLAVCGSLPPGTDPAWLAEVITTSPLPVAVDTSGAALVAAAGARPRLLKPNREELAELAGRPLTTLADVVEAAEQIVQGGVGMVAASLGADGAILADATGWWFANARIDAPASTVGAGDCLLAGLLAALDRGESPAQALAAGVAWGAAAVTLPGSGVPHPADTTEIAVTTIPPHLDHPLGA